MILNRCIFVAVLTLTALSCGTSFAALTGEYLFEEGSGTTAVDTSGNGRSAPFAGTVGLPTYGPGLYTGSNSSLRLNSDGTTSMLANAQKIQLPSATNYITNATGATLTAWVKLEGAIGTANKTIISIANGDVGGNSGQGLSRATIQINGTNGQFRAIGRKDDTGGSSSAQSGSLVPVAGQTYFVAGVFNYTGGYVRLFVDGVQVGNTNVAAWNTNSANSANLTSALGTVSATNAPIEYWPGLIDGARIFNTALTDAQVLGLFQNPNSVPSPFKLGDTNNNGTVDVNDLIPIRQNYLQTGMTRAQGDLTDDLQVTFADFRQWKTAFVAGGGSLENLDLNFASVPEPAAAILLAVGGLFATVAGNRRRRAS